MLNLGTVRPGSTLYIPWSTFAAATGAPVTMTNLAVGDILIYKDGSTTERASTSGFTLLDTDGTDFDGKTGLHAISIDLADDTTADFWKAGSSYILAIADVTVDGQTLRFWQARFDIGYAIAQLNTHIASLTNQTQFTLNVGPAEDDALNDLQVIIHDKASSVQVGRAVVLDYTGSSKTVTLAAAPTFTIAAGDNISILPFLAPLMPITQPNRAAVDSNGKLILQATQTGVVIPTVTTLTNAPPDSSGVTTLLSKIIGTLATGTHSPQSGDAYGVVSHGTYGNAALKTAIDALATMVTNLNNLSALANLRGPGVMEIPDSGTMVYKFLMTVCDQEGKLVDLDASPTITAANAAGTDRSAKLSAVTHPATGRYEFTYTVSSTDGEESIVVKAAGATSSEARYADFSTSVVNYDSLTTINSILTNLNALITTVGTAGVGLTNLGDARLANLDATVSSRLADADYTAPDNAGIGTAASNTATILTNLSTLAGDLATLAGKFTGITSLADWLRRGFRKDAGTAGMGTALGEINAGGGSFAAGDALEGIRDAITGGGGGGPTVVSVAIPKATARAILEADGNIGITRGDTLRISFEGDNALGDLSGRTKLVFTCKRSRSVSDDDAIIQITEAGGLVRLNGAAAGTSAWGVINVLDAVLGEVDIVLYASATALLSPRQGALWDIKQFLAASPDDAVSVSEGTLTVTAGITQATT